MTTNLKTQVLLGRFENITNEQYHKELLHAFSKSDLTAMMLSPSNMVQRRVGPSKPSDAKEFGTAFHARLEHYNNEDAYLKMVAVPPTADKRTKEGKAAHEAFEKANTAPIVLDPKEWDLLENMLLAVKSHPDANELLMAEGINEETFIWKDEETGVICKCRPDKRITKAPLGMPDNIIIDWKTAASCERKDLQNAIGERYYDMQAALITDGVAAVLGHSVGPFVNVFIEKGRDFRVVLGVVDDASIEEGRRLYKEQLRQIAYCQKNNSWPGFVDFSLPTWRVLGMR